MKTYVLGDVHGQVGFFRRAVEDAIARECRALVQVGDFGLWWPSTLGDLFMERVREITEDAAAAGLTCYVLPGNHDNYDAIDFHMETMAGDVACRTPVHVYKNLIYLPKGAAFTLGDTRCLALGGAVSVDRKWRRQFAFDPRMKNYWPQEIVSEEDCLAAQVNILEHKPDVLFTHAVPGFYPVPMLPPLHLGPWAYIEDEVVQEQSLIQRMVVEFATELGHPFHTIVHGHTHVKYDMPYPPDENIRVVGLASDESSIQRGDPWVILEL